MSWISVALGEICEFQGGSQPPKSNFIYEPQEGYVRFLQIRDFSTENNHTFIPINNKNKTCESNDIMIGRYGASVGKILRGRRGAYNVALMKATPNQKLINEEYIWNYFNSYLFQEKLRKVASRSAQDGFSKEDIYNFQVPLPSLATQQKIVEKLDLIFAEIDRATVATAIKVKKAEALFQSYLNEVFDSNNDFAKRLKDCCLIKPPKSEAKALSDDDDVSFMPMDTLGINEKYAIPNQVRKLSDVVGGYTYFSEGDVLLAKITPCFENGKLGIAKNLMNKTGFGSSEYIVFRPNAEVDSNWLYYFLNREKFRKDGAKHMSGAVGHKRVTKEFIEDSMLPLPSLATQKKLVEDIESIFAFSKSILLSSNLKLREYDSLKQSILKQAFNGELVKE